MPQLVLPRVQAMVVCDGIEESEVEPGTFHLKGVRSEITALHFPYTRPRLCVYLQMSGHRGEASCRVAVNRTETDEIVYRTSPRVIAFEGPMPVVPVIFRLRNCSFPAPGLDYVQMFHESKLIGERPLYLLAEG